MAYNTMVYVDIQVDLPNLLLTVYLQLQITTPLG